MHSVHDLMGSGILVNSIHPRSLCSYFEHIADALLGKIDKDHEMYSSCKS